MGWLKISFILDVIIRRRKQEKMSERLLFLDVSSEMIPCCIQGYKRFNLCFIFQLLDIKIMWIHKIFHIF